MNIYKKIKKEILKGKTVYLDVSKGKTESRLRIINLSEVLYGNYHYGDIQQSCFIKYLKKSNKIRKLGFKSYNIDDVVDAMMRYDKNYGTKIVKMRAEQ